MRTRQGLMIAILPDLFLTVLGIVPGAMMGVDQFDVPAMAAEPLVINTAAADLLKALPGIGEAYSVKIINAGRTSGRTNWSRRRSSPRRPTT